MLKKLDAVLTRLYLFCGYLAAFCLAMICPMVLANIFGRWIGVFVPGTNEVGGYLMAAAGTLGLAYTFGLNGHIRVSTLVNRLQPARRRVVEIISLVIAALLVVFLSKHLIDMVLLSHEYEDRSSGTDNMLIWIAQAPMVFGFVVFTIALFHALIAAFAINRPIYPQRETL